MSNVHAIQEKDINQMYNYVLWRSINRPELSCEVFLVNQSYF